MLKHLVISRIIANFAPLNSALQCRSIAKLLYNSAMGAFWARSLLAGSTTKTRKRI